MVAGKKTAYAAIIALLAALIAYTFTMRYRRVEAPPPPALERIPPEIAGYAADDEALDENTLDVLGADATLVRTYRRAGEPPIRLFIGYFAAPHENSQIHSPKHCYPGSGWNILEEGRSPVAAGGAAWRAGRLLISNGVERQFVLYWYLAADGVLADEFALKWSQMKSSLLGRPRATVFVRFSTEIGANGNIEETERALVRFAGEIAPHIDITPARIGGGTPSSEPRRGREGS